MSKWLKGCRSCMGKSLDPLCLIYEKGSQNFPFPKTVPLYIISSKFLYRNLKGFSVWQNFAQKEPLSLALDFCVHSNCNFNIKTLQFVSLYWYSSRLSTNHIIVCLSNMNLCFVCRCFSFFNVLKSVDEVTLSLNNILDLFHTAQLRYCNEVSWEESLGWKMTLDMPQKTVNALETAWSVLFSTMRHV